MGIQPVHPAVFPPGKRWRIGGQTDADGIRQGLLIKLPKKRQVETGQARASARKRQDKEGQQYEQQSSGHGMV